MIGTLFAFSQGSARPNRSESGEGTAWSQAFHASGEVSTVAARKLPGKALPVG
jgi:hypothetical protein